MRPTMTPQFNDAPAVPSKSQEEEGICHGSAQYAIEKLNMHASKLFGDTSTDDCAIRLSAAPRKKESAKCTELVMHGDIQTIVNSEPIEAHVIRSDSSTHAGSELGEAHSQCDDYNIYSNSELGEAHVHDDDVIVPYGDSRGNYADMQRPFDYPWAGPSKPLSSSTSSSVMKGSIKTDDNDDPVQDDENYETYGNEFIQTIENNPETGAAATAKVSGSCPVLENAKAVSACAEAYRKADALVLARSQTSSNAVVPRAATAYESHVLKVMCDESPFERRKPKVSEAVSNIKMGKEDNSNAYEKSLVNIASLPVFDEIRKTFATAISCFSSGLCKGKSNRKRKRGKPRINNKKKKKMKGDIKINAIPSLVAQIDDDDEIALAASPSDFSTAAKIARTFLNSIQGKFNVGAFSVMMGVIDSAISHSDTIYDTDLLTALPSCISEDDVLYIADTGAGAHLIKWLATLKIKKGGRPVRFITANGRVDSLGSVIKEVKPNFKFFRIPPTFSV